MTGARRLVIGVGLAAAIGGCRETQRVEQPLTPVRALAAEAAPAGNALRYSATIQPFAQINVAFKVGGYVDNPAYPNVVFVYGLHPGQ